MEKIKVYCAVIGGGAAGLMCACVAKKRNSDKKIVVIEKDNRVGKKILVSGNSRCNLSNINTNAQNYHSDSFDDFSFLLENYPPSKIINYFDSIGLLCTTEDDGRVYPLSKQSTAVLSVLRNEIRRNGVEEFCDTEVLSISKVRDSYEIKCNDKIFIAEKVVIATGGKNNYAQKVLSDTFAPSKSLGHKTTQLSPSLSPVKVKNKYIKSLKGIRATGRVTAVVNSKKIKSEYGEIQFTNDALSGICVFNLSRIVNRNKNSAIIVQLLPDYSFEEIKTMLHKRIELTKNECVQELFTGLFNKNIALAILKESKVDISISAKKLTTAMINSICSTINSWKFECISDSDFSKAQVTAGGVRCEEINTKTFESKIAKNVYLCGEVLDVDGDCGGFNLQFAFSSGMCVGEQI